MKPYKKSPPDGPSGSDWIVFCAVISSPFWIVFGVIGIARLLGRL